jgi:hypothetical protein
MVIPAISAIIVVTGGASVPDSDFGLADFGSACWNNEAVPQLAICVVALHYFYTLQ